MFLRTAHFRGNGQACPSSLRVKSSLPLPLLSAVSGIRPHFPQHCLFPDGQTHDWIGRCHSKPPNSESAVQPEQDWVLTTTGSKKKNIINMKSNRGNCNTIGKIFPFGRRPLQLQPPLTLEKLGLRACNSGTVAKAEKSPKFACSHSLLSVIDDTQPGSAKKTETKTLRGYYNPTLSRLYQTKSVDCLLPDESFLDRNGLAK